MKQSIFRSHVMIAGTAVAMTVLVLLFKNAAGFSQSASPSGVAPPPPSGVRYTSALQQQLQHDRGLALLANGRTTPQPPRQKQLEDATTTHEQLVRAMNTAVKAVSTINSLAALTVPNMQKAGLASTTLLQRLLAAREIETGQTTLAIRLDEAVTAMIHFANHNSVVPDSTLIRRQNSVVLKNKVTGQEASLDEAKNLFKSYLAGESVDTLRKRIQDIDSMTDLLSVMEEASRYQDGLRRIGASLRRVAESLGAHVDVRPIEAFAFQLFRR